MAEDRPPRNVKLGRILGATGLRGWLKIQSYTDPPENLLQHQRWELADRDGQRASVEVAEGRFDGRWIRARLAGVEDRDGADALRGRDVEVARSALPPTAPREYYRDDLIGLRVRTREGGGTGSREPLCRGAERAGDGGAGRRARALGSGRAALFAPGRFRAGRD